MGVWWGCDWISIAHPSRVVGLSIVWQIGGLGDIGINERMRNEGLSLPSLEYEAIGFVNCDHWILLNSSSPVPQ